ncbi:hypothetical protein J6590_023032 [Homalodisca vitripennis]|nr:hypothetical protein J6590_023032 [Homalodisca vitripennis]
MGLYSESRTGLRRYQTDHSSSLIDQLYDQQNNQLCRFISTLSITVLSGHCCRISVPGHRASHIPPPLSPEPICQARARRSNVRREVRAKKPSLTQPRLGTNGLKVTPEPPPMAGQADCLQGQDRSAVTHASSSHARRCFIRLSRDKIRYC